MVYCGIPSKACGACRAKRTKCDQAVPSCGQCRRARRDCPGYRDAQDLVFRNETKHVVSKAQATKSSSSRHISKQASPPPTPGVPDDFDFDFDFDFNSLEASDSNALVPCVLPTANSVFSPRSLTISIEDQASYFFFHHFVASDSIPVSSYSNFLPTLYNRATQSGSATNPLPGVVTAIGMAGISNLQGSPTAMVATRQKHTAVLRSLNASLQDPRTASTDSTLMAVMLLGLFETITCTTPQSLKSWANHIRGALAIAQVRGPEQLETEIGRNIFSHLRNQIITDCIQRRRPVPPEIMEWADLALELDSSLPRQRENQIFQIFCRLCSLRSCFQPRGESQNDPIVVTLARDIDADLIEWENGFPDLLRYTTKSSKLCEDVLSDYYHVYPSTWITGGYNMYRIARILVHELILNWLSRNSPSDSMQRRESEVVLARMSADICASVPFILGGVEPGKREGSLPRAAAAILLVWPLYVAATWDGATEDTKAWVITRLDKLGHDMGVQQALSLADVLRANKEITAWDRFESMRMDEELDDW